MKTITSKKKENLTEEEIRENKKWWNEFRSNPVVQLMARAEEIATKMNEMELEENANPYWDEDSLYIGEEISLLIVFFYTLWAGYLGWQWRRVRTIQNEINELEKQFKPVPSSHKDPHLQKRHRCHLLKPKSNNSLR